MYYVVKLIIQQGQPKGQDPSGSKRWEDKDKKMIIQFTILNEDMITEQRAKKNIVKERGILEKERERQMDS